MMQWKMLVLLIKNATKRKNNSKLQNLSVKKNNGNNLWVNQILWLMLIFMQMKKLKNATNLLFKLLTQKIKNLKTILVRLSKNNLTVQRDNRLLFRKFLNLFNRKKNKITTTCFKEFLLKILTIWTFEAKID